MAYGNEVILGFGFPDFGSVLRREFRITLPSPQSNDWEEQVRYWDCINCDPEEEHDPAILKLQEKLEAAHTKACLAMGFTLAAKQGSSYPAYVTPLGLREMSPWRLASFYDPIELGDNPTTALFGVAISGRYFPTFLDWRDPHGTMTSICCDPKQKDWQIARKQIMAVLPWMKEAKFYVKELHY